MFVQFLDWFDRHKFGVIGTLMLHTFLMFFLAMSSLKNAPAESAPDEIVLEMQAPPEPPPEEQARQMLNTGSVTNLSSNTTADESPSRSTLSRATQERISENVEADLKDLEKAEFDRLAKERAEQGKDVVMPQLDPSKWDKERYMEKPVKPVKVEGDATVEYDLVGRRDIVLDVPAYKCPGRGMVVITVEVTADGRVRRADIDRSRTSTADACLLDNAMESAQGARFNSSTSSPDPQRGTITYRFVAQ